MTFDPHMTTTYCIVPFDDVNPGILPHIAEGSLDTLHHNLSSEPVDLVIVKWMRYKKPGQGKGPDHPKDKGWSDEELENNDKHDGKGYKHVHWQTPGPLRDYDQYTLPELTTILATSAWNPDFE